MCVECLGEPWGEWFILCMIPSMWEQLPLPLRARASGQRKMREPAGGGEQGMGAHVNGPLAGEVNECTRRGQRKHTASTTLHHPPAKPCTPPTHTPTHTHMHPKNKRTLRPPTAPSTCKHAPHHESRCASCGPAAITALWSLDPRPIAPSGPACPPSALAVPLHTHASMLVLVLSVAICLRND